MEANITTSFLEKILLEPFSTIMTLRPDSPLYAEIKEESKQRTIQLFSSNPEGKIQFGPFGEIIFPYFNMGNVSSIDLFYIDELIIFNFYLKNRNTYKNYVDMGANIGLHTILASLCGFTVRSFEPDPVHFEMLQKRVQMNNLLPEPQLYNAAVSNTSGTMNFCRVKGNTTSSHLTGSKPNPYGELAHFDVTVENALEHMAWADLVKMDIEGHEAQVLCATTRDLWLSTDAIVEISREENARSVYSHMKDLDVSIYAQKIGWQKVGIPEEMPFSYRDGSILITSKPQIPWGE